MTREEAKHIINSSEYFWLRSNDKEREALCMASKALEQESFNPMVEIDLYSVIKQKYIEREVLDKIRTEITELRDSYEKDNYHDEADTLTTALAILDKYKAESEASDG